MAFQTSFPSLSSSSHCRFCQISRFSSCRFIWWVLGQKLGSGFSFIPALLHSKMIMLAAFIAPQWKLNYLAQCCYLSCIGCCLLQSPWEPECGARRPQLSKYVTELAAQPHHPFCCAVCYRTDCTLQCVSWTPETLELWVCALTTHWSVSTCCILFHIGILSFFLGA
jgi:hypothetical protein